MRWWRKLYKVLGMLSLLSVIYIYITLWKSLVMNSMHTHMYRPVNSGHMEFTTHLDTIFQKNNEQLFNITMFTKVSGGRLGNNMYQYAALMGISKRHHRYAFLTTSQFHRLSPMFQLSLPIRDDVDISSYHHIRNFQIKPIKSLKQFEAGLPETNIILKGQYQSYKYFENINYQLRNDFNLKQIVITQALQFLRNNSAHEERNLIRVGIHVRRTDHITKAYMKSGYVFPEDSYFDNAMMFFISKYTNVQFIIISDDIPWCKTNFRRFHNYKLTFSENNSFPVDFGILTQCDHVIITLGTFGWWAGWLNRGTTVYMKDFPINNTKAAKIYLPGYYIPPDDEYNHWVGIQAYSIQKFKLKTRPAK